MDKNYPALQLNAGRIVYSEDEQTITFVPTKGLSSEARWTISSQEIPRFVEFGQTHLRTTVSVGSNR
jgi:hypothetical protein